MAVKYQSWNYWAVKSSRWRRVISTGAPDPLNSFKGELELYVCGNHIISSISIPTMQVYIYQQKTLRTKCPSSRVTRVCGRRDHNAQ